MRGPVRKIARREAAIHHHVTNLIAALAAELAADDRNSRRLEVARRDEAEIGDQWGAIGSAICEPEFSLVAARDGRQEAGHCGGLDAGQLLEPRARPLDASRHVGVHVLEIAAAHAEREHSLGFEPGIDARQHLEAAQQQPCPREQRDRQRNLHADEPPLHAMPPGHLSAAGARQRLAAAGTAHRGHEPAKERHDHGRCRRIESESARRARSRRAAANPARARETNPQRRPRGADPHRPRQTPAHPLRRAFAQQSRPPKRRASGAAPLRARAPPRARAATTRCSRTRSRAAATPRRTRATTSRGTRPRGRP